MLEKDFIDIIDCNFPYNDLEKSIELYKLASSISDNAVFILLEESVRIPKNLMLTVDKWKIKKFLIYVLENYKHKLLKDIIDVSLNVIDDIKNNESYILSLMNELKEFEWLYWALNILYFSINDISWLIDIKYNEVIEKWNNAMT